MIVYHIPVCPFSQRLEILLALKGRRAEVDFQVVDITRPREDWLLQKSGGTTALPILEIAGGRIVKESLVILQPGRARSSFVFEPHWRERPWPPRDKYRHSATDRELGL